eukprot:541913-Rhodomonas_salina.1
MEVWKGGRGVSNRCRSMSWSTAAARTRVMRFDSYRSSIRHSCAHTHTDRQRHPEPAPGRCQRAAGGSRARRRGRGELGEEGGEGADKGRHGGGEERRVRCGRAHCSTSLPQQHSPPFRLQT